MLTVWKNTKDAVKRAKLSRELDRLCRSPVPSVRDWWSLARERLGEELAQDIRAIRGAERLNILPEAFLFANDLMDFAAEFRGGISEVVRWPLYGYRAYAAAGHTELGLLDQSFGDATNGLGDTNMQRGGMMTGGEAHVVLSLRINPLPAQADVRVANGPALALTEWYNALQLNCWLEFMVVDKLYLRGGPLTMFPAGFGLGSAVTASAAAVTTANIQLVQNGHPSNQALYQMNPPLLLLPNRTFTVTLRWRAVQAVTTAGKIGAYLDGYRIRAVQ